MPLKLQILKHKIKIALYILECNFGILRKLNNYNLIGFSKVFDFEKKKKIKGLLCTCPADLTNFASANLKIFPANGIATYFWCKKIFGITFFT